MLSSRMEVAHRVARDLQTLPHVVALALGGSSMHARDDALSDLDIEVFVTTDPPLGDRESLILPQAQYAEIGNHFFGSGDEWIDRASGVEIDAAFWPVDWIADQLDRVLTHHQASLGYTTCFWYTVRSALPLYDPAGWLAQTQSRARVPYPEPLRQAIIALNHPVLHTKMHSYRDQIRIAIARADLVSVQHRVTALLASYFDIIFAINRLPHPGEKRLVDIATRTCGLLPTDMAGDIAAVLAATADPHARNLLGSVQDLCDHLDTLLQQEQCYPAS